MTGGINKGVWYLGTDRGSSVPPGIGTAETRWMKLLPEVAYNESMPAPLSFRKSRLEIISSSFLNYHHLHYFISANADRFYFQISFLHPIVF